MDRRRQRPDLLKRCRADSLDDRPSVRNTEMERDVGETRSTVGTIASTDWGPSALPGAAFAGNLLAAMLLFESDGGELIVEEVQDVKRIWADV